MTREQAKELLSIIQAFAEGNTIQEKIEGITGWEDTDEINLEFEGKKIIHRIKPEPKYRPFKNVEECWNEMQNHQPFGWVMDRNKDYSCILSMNNKKDFSYMFKNFIFADGTPYGIKEVEHD